MQSCVLHIRCAISVLLLFRVFSQEQRLPLGKPYSYGIASFSFFCVRTKNGWPSLVCGALETFSVLAAKFTDVVLVNGGGVGVGVGVVVVGGVGGVGAGYCVDGGVSRGVSRGVGVFGACWCVLVSRLLAYALVFSLLSVCFFRLCSCLLYFFSCFLSRVVVPRQMS